MKNAPKDEINNAEMITISRSEYEALKEQMAEQSRQIEWLMQQIRLG
ncbi:MULTISPECIES: hypothetical protein [Dehalobacter]|jgi:hypothetical protein|nr:MULTISPECIES: hypothetical protein [Dehalobacter]